MVPQAPNRRAMRAWIVLQDAPLPESVRFDIHPDAEIGECVYLNLTTGSDLLVWAELLGIPENSRDRHQNDTTGTWINTARIRLAGWHLSFTAYDPPESGSGLDVETGLQLQRLVDEGTP